ncbi:hypothetical protein E3U23_02635 [Erythrobacter litoralis]|uniref:hypothetical protein n=1 Tax=Erythrobacter litoralis TaxID=39960 RepID=UPI00243515E7|nr:hypothetical protein [Erythrobacter litoralis]MDG6078090.1 hypothetical protein [Erythrobacter litoralis]
MLPIELAGKRIAEDLDAAERLANEFLRAAAKLQTSMMNACIDSELSPHDGQVAVARVQEAQSQIVGARANLLKAHKSMRSDFIRIVGLPDTFTRCPTGTLEDQSKVA